MTDILYELYSGDYDITPEQDKRQRELDKKRYLEWDKIQAVLGDEFIDRLFALEAEYEDIRAFHYYRAGFRLGVRLMLEVFTSATA